MGQLGRTFRRERAQGRLDAAFGLVADRLGMTFDDPKPRRRDADEEAVAHVELMATRLEAISEAIGEPIEAEAFDVDAAIMAAYSLYDADERVNGPDDFEAFKEALTKTMVMELEDGEEAIEPTPDASTAPSANDDAEKAAVFAAVQTVAAKPKGR